MELLLSAPLAPFDIPLCGTRAYPGALEYPLSTPVSTPCEYPCEYPLEYPILEYQVTAVGGTKPSGSNETAWEDSGGGFSNVAERYPGSTP